MADPVRLVEGGPATRLRQRDSLGDNLFRLGNIHQDETRGDEIERSVREPRARAVHHPERDVREALFGRGRPGDPPHTNDDTTTQNLADDAVLDRLTVNQLISQTRPWAS